MKSIYNSVSLYIRPPQPVAREQHVARDIVFVMLTAQTFEVRKRLLILSLSKQK
jgi:5-methylcytosine-specific restriction endonuclease McrBC GTP-binding regulatory subunit McrB